MSTTDAVRAEEQAARAQAKSLTKAGKAAASRRLADERARVAEALADTAQRFPNCRCGLRRGMTRSDLRELNGGCTMPDHACPRLDAVRRRLER